MGEIAGCSSAELEFTLGPSQIATAVGMRAGNVRRLLSKMKADSIIQKASYGKYTLSKQEKPT